MNPASGKDAAAARPDPGPADAPSPEEAPARQAQVKALTEERDRLKAELGDARDRYLRTRADYDNLVRRNQKENLDTIRGAKGALLLRFTGVLETLEKAAEAADAPKGVKLVADEVRKLLKDEGVKEIDTAGAFNYRHHQAVESVESADTPEGTILGVVQRGYLLHSEILRPALVRVAAPPRKPPAKPESAAAN